MIPKVIHLCWFSNDPYPVEIKVCLDTWKCLMPDYVVKVWDYAAAKSIGCAFIDEALEARKWLSLPMWCDSMPYIRKAASIWIATSICIAVSTRFFQRMLCHFQREG